MERGPFSKPSRAEQTPLVLFKDNRIIPGQTPSLIAADLQTEISVDVRGVSPTNVEPEYVWRAILQPQVEGLVAKVVEYKGTDASAFEALILEAAQQLKLDP